MSRLAIIALLFVACQKDRTWSGIPDGGIPACEYAAHDYDMRHCIAGGKRYDCLLTSSWSDNHLECAPTFVTVLPEH